MERVFKEYKCEICGKPFLSRSISKPKYCSKECKYQAAKARIIASYKNKDRSCVCTHCGKVFQKTGQRQKFCSRHCCMAEYTPTPKKTNYDIASDDVEPYDALAVAIIAQAANDYRQALKDSKIPSKRNAAMHTIRETEGFFKSEWYMCLTSVPPENILKRIRAEVIALDNERMAKQSIHNQQQA